MMCRSVVQAACAALVLLFAFASPVLANEPPAARPQVVFTKGSEPLEIILQGSDPELRDLRFEIVEGPQFGSLSDPEPIVPEPQEGDGRDEGVQPPVTSARVVYRADKLVPDSFTFSAIDAEGASGMATVTINPPSGDEPPPPPVTTVIAQDTTANVFRDVQATLTLAGAAPQGVRLRFRILSQPAHGNLGELTQASDVTATVPYSPQRGYLGGDAFEFEACGEVGGKEVCDAARYGIEIIERPQEPVILAGDIHTKTPNDRPHRFTLGEDHRNSIEDKPVVLGPIVAGNVADKDGDGKGDNRNDLPGPDPLFMRAGVRLDDGAGATGTARMHIEWDLGPLEKVNEITGAEVLVQTLRRTEEGTATAFHAAGSEGDGELSERDFETDVERVRGAVMPVPSLNQMPVGSEGTFTFDVSGELKAAIRDGFRVFAVQGRINEEQKERIAGLDLRTSAFENLERELAPRLIVKTARRPEPLVYTVRSLPKTGTLKDDLGNEIRDVPYRLPNAYVVYVPPAGFVGQTSFQFEATDGLRVDIAQATIVVFFGRCAEDADYCNNGR